MTDYPHVPAAFINAIAEEGTKAKAIEWLQKQWNENCALRAELESLDADLERCMSNLTTAEAEIDRLNGHAPRMPWERADTANIDPDSFYLVQDNGGEWRDFDLSIMRGRMVIHKMEPSYIRGRPEWIAKIDRPLALSINKWRVDHERS